MTRYDGSLEFWATALILMSMFPWAIHGAAIVFGATNSVVRSALLGILGAIASVVLFVVADLFDPFALLLGLCLWVGGAAALLRGSGLRLAVGGVGWLLGLLVRVLIVWVSTRI